MISGEPWGRCALPFPDRLPTTPRSRRVGWDHRGTAGSARACGHCVGIEGEGIKGVLEDARMEDLSHFESCIERIYQLGGKLPTHAHEFVEMSGCEFLQVPEPSNDLTQILEKCLRAEQGAIANWNQVCNMTFGKDPVTYDLAKDLLAEEIEHEAWFLELLHGRPSGHMRRRYPGESPHTRKHSRALDR